MLKFLKNWIVEGQKVQHTFTVQLCVSMQDEDGAAFSLFELYQHWPATQSVYWPLQRTYWEDRKKSFYDFSELHETFFSVLSVWKVLVEGLSTSERSFTYLAYLTLLLTVTHATQNSKPHHAWLLTTYVNIPTSKHICLNPLFFCFSYLSLSLYIYSV